MSPHGVSGYPFHTQRVLRVHERLVRRKRFRERGKILRVINHVARIDQERCNACSTCVKVCPVEAIELKQQEKRTFAAMDAQKFLGCTICISRCPVGAIAREQRPVPLKVGVDPRDVAEEAVAEICEAAHMYPDQVVCFCRRIQAKEVAAAILKGAETPEEISRKTGVRTGCGVLCITGVLRLLKAAGVELNRAPGYQWYGADISIWNISEEVQKKFPTYFLSEDRQAIDNLFPGGKHR